MTKKYIFHAPDDIGIKDSQWEHLKLIDGKVVKLISYQGEYREVCLWNYDYPVFKVFGDWLEEIKAEPVSAEEWSKANAEKMWKGHNFLLTEIEFGINTFKAGEANERLRHRPQQTFDEWCKENNVEPSCAREDVWKGCLKSLNLQEN